MWGLYRSGTADPKPSLAMSPPPYCSCWRSPHGQAPGLPTCTCDHVDTAALRVARRHNQLGSWRFRQPGDLGLILLAAALPYAARVRSVIGGCGKGSPGGASPKSTG